MEMWELVKSLLAHANGAQSFSPRLVAFDLARKLQAAGHEKITDKVALATYADEIGAKMQAAGLIEGAPSPRAGLAILDVMHLTELGQDLYDWLPQRGIVEFFQSMGVELEKGAIQRALHQLNS
jgi:hypothetical protein